MKKVAISPAVEQSLKKIQGPGFFAGKDNNPDVDKTTDALLSLAKHTKDSFNGNASELLLKLVTQSNVHKLVIPEGENAGKKESFPHIADALKVVRRVAGLAGYDKGLVREYVEAKMTADPTKFFKQHFEEEAAPAYFILTNRECRSTLLRLGGLLSDIWSQYGKDIVNEPGKYVEQLKKIDDYAKDFLNEFQYRTHQSPQEISASALVGQLDKVANYLEQNKLIHLAKAIDEVSNALEKEAKLALVPAFEELEAKLVDMGDTVRVDDLKGLCKGMPAPFPGTLDKFIEEQSPNAYKIKVRDFTDFLKKELKI